MLTALFLVSLSATALLTAVVAADEALRATRRLLTRRGAAEEPHTFEFASSQSRARVVGPDAEPTQAGVRRLTQRVRAPLQARGPRDDEGLPDRAA